ncbi:exodeoxyribonuclease VII large subunit [Salibacterium salarium]|uniref:exodeoxyribonuclease VII large subunit n=1 Tax=Salibacterium salarium TaxID=284579 RepID=UPI00277FE0E7|nr:exodeoxyribonuclease VII large subunit [Salibacterium salarium]MDQ0299577.1 exodeoxyribonuclease VII large subunit [Salibacterium salarium]
MKQYQGSWLSVSQLTTQIKKTIELDDELQQVWLRAEISNFKKHSRGHMYFTLKDDKSKISAVMFAGNNRRLTFEPENGMKVLIKGHISVYEPFGQYQLYVREMEPDGIGQLYIKYEQLKKKLEQEGLFDKERKKDIPSFPREIAIITSPTGAAIRDMVTTLKRRFPVTRITLFPVLVQGKEAPSSIVTAMNQMESMGSFDLLLFGRGGGSIEELWAFNEEAVARKIAALSTPSISAVGHETDFTIADFIADIRAATPTAAAELAVPDVNELERQHNQLKARLQRAVQGRLSSERERLNRMKRSYAFRYPTHLLKQKEQELDRLISRLEKALTAKKVSQKERLQSIYKRLYRQHPYRLLDIEKNNLNQMNKRMDIAMKRFISGKEDRFNHVLQKLQILNPLDIMKRGYNVAYSEKGTIIKSIKHVDAGERITMYLQDGAVQTKAESFSDVSLWQTDEHSNEGED